MALLLDFPWSLADFPSTDFRPSEILRQFASLWRTVSDRPTPIFSEEDVAAFVSRTDLPPASAPAILRVLAVMMRGSDHSCEAFPPPSIDSTPAWRRALFDEVHNSDWRRPRIVTYRATKWEEAGSVRVVADACGGHLLVSDYPVTIVSLTDFAGCEEISREDNPWDVRVLHAEASRGRSETCVLPRPATCVFGTPDFAANLAAARSDSDASKHHLYYLPPENWDPVAVGREDWYAGHAFPRAFSRDGSRRGFLDFRGWIWLWDRNEQHWDVQLGGSFNYYRVLPDGRILPD